MVLHGMSLTVNDGELVVLIGPNGAGKTTLLKTIIGLIKPKNGEVWFDGRNISKLSPGRVSNLGIGYVQQDNGTFPQMTVYENIEAGGYLIRDRNLVKKRIEQVLALFPRLGERLKNKAFSLSGGERQMLLLGRALMLDPKLLLLDEPSLGLDPKTQSILYTGISALNKSGKSILLVEQNVRRALQIANRCYVQEVGQTVFEGSPGQLGSVEKIKKAYLGV